jgi:hypothetical protein
MKEVATVRSAMLWLCALLLAATTAACEADDAVNLPAAESGLGINVGISNDV